MGISSALATARPHEVRLEGQPPSAEEATDQLGAGASSAAEAEWRLSGRLSGVDDPLLASLVNLTELLERPASPQALLAGLPLPEDVRFITNVVSTGIVSGSAGLLRQRWTGRCAKRASRRPGVG